MAAELAGTVGKVVEKATDLGLSVVEEVGLRILEALAPSKPAEGTGMVGTAASMLNKTRAEAPKFTGKVANKLTGLVVGGGFEMLRTIQEAARPRRRSD
jgi:hypothetical protein